MHKDKPPKKPHKKFRILLDCAFPKPKALPKLSKKSNLAHAVHDLRLPTQAEDREIYQKAIEENRFVVTINYKDFRKLVKKGKPGIIGIESELSNADVDEIVSNFLSGKDPDDYIGKAIRIQGERKIKN